MRTGSRAPGSLIALLALGACAGLPEVPLTEAGRGVTLVRDRHALPAACRLTGTVGAQDGRTYGPGHFDGTVERALRAARNRAAEQGANVLLVPRAGEDDGGSVHIDIAGDCANCGSVVSVTGSAYRCPTPAAG